MKTLTEADLELAAERLGIELAAIRAVDEVESLGSGFLDDGRVRILFERHKFHEFTKGAYDHSHPDISNEDAGGYGRAGANQYARFSRAFELDPEAAMKSASWGRYQIMGFNHRAAGFDTVGQFVDAMKVSEGSQLIAFVNVIKAWGLAGELRNHDWAGFARQYNGSKYRKNKYDTKLAAAYEKFSREFEQPESHHAAKKPSVTVEAEDKGVTTSPDKSETETAGTPPPAPAAEVKPSQVSLFTKLTSLSFPASALTALGAAWKFMSSQPPYFWAAFCLMCSVFSVIGYLIWRDAKRQAHERTLKVMDAAAAPEKNNLRLV